jgi:DNA mismatch repair protein MSH5
MNLIPNDSGFKALQMQVHIPETSDESATPLFQLKDGVALSSAGLVCASMAGVRPAIITRAREILSAIQEGRHVQPLSEILYGENALLSSAAKDAVGQFIKTKWKEASQDEIHELSQKASQL